MRGVFFKVSGILECLELCLAGAIFGLWRKSQSQFPISLSGLMVSPFRYDEGVTIYINGERIASGLLMIEEQNVERSVATEDAQRFKSR